MKLEKKLAISGVSSVTFLITYFSGFQNKAVGLAALAMLSAHLTYSLRAFAKPENQGEEEK